MKIRVDEEALEQIALRLRAMGTPLRLRLLHALEGRELSVGRLVEEVGSQQATVSNQLRVLWHAGLVSRRREGSVVYYGLADARVMEICRTMCHTLSGALTRRLASIERGRRAILTPREDRRDARSLRPERMRLAGSAKRS